MKKKKLPLYQEHYNNKNWVLAEKYLKKEISEYPKDHYAIALLASVYLETNKFIKAQRLISKALQIKPNCPVVMWHFANICEVIGKKDWAKTTWEEIIKRGVKKIAYDECGEGIAEARSLIKDVKKRLKAK